MLNFSVIPLNDEKVKVFAFTDFFLKNLFPFHVSYSSIVCLKGKLAVSSFDKVSKFSKFQ